MNSTALPYRYFGTHRQWFAAARLRWPAYDDGRKREDSSEKIALLLHLHVDVPCSLVVTQHDFGWQMVSP